jgi:hypothetical protein
MDGDTDMPDDLEIELFVGAEFVMHNNTTDRVELFANFMKGKRILLHELIGTIRPVR